MYIRQHHSQPWAQRPGGLVRSGRALPPVHACVHGRRQATIFASLPTDGRRGQPATLGHGILVVTPSPCVITKVLKTIVRFACTDSASTPLSPPNPAPLQIPPPPPLTPIAAWRGRPLVRHCLCQFGPGVAG